MKSPEPVPTLRAALRFAQRDLPPATMRVPGPTLVLYREASGIAAREVAKRMNVSKQYISRLEQEGVNIETAKRYRAAVDMLAAEQRKAAEVTA